MADLALKYKENLNNESCKFEALLDELTKLESWDEQFSLSEEEVSVILKQKKIRKKELLKKIVQRLKSETDIESRLQGIVDLSIIVDLQQFIDESFFVYETNFEEEKGRKAQYFAGFIVLAKADYDRSEQALKDLCNGHLPDDFVSIFHERIHRTQRGIRRHINKPDESKLLLEDVHAYQGENEIYPFGFSAQNFIDRIMQDPAVGLKLSPDEIRDRVIMACSQIERLMAQGITHEQIGKLIQKTRWNARKACFSGLEKNTMNEEGQDGLVDKMRIQRKINLLKIKRIAQEVISVNH